MSGCVRALGHNTRDEVFLGVGTIEGSHAPPAPRAQTNKEAKAEKLVSENQTHEYVLPGTTQCTQYTDTCW